MIDITSSNLSALAALNIPADAKARISTEIAQGFGVIVPESTVDLNGTPTISWAEINLATGEYIGVNEDGGHEGAFEFVGLVAEGIELAIGVVKFFSPVMAFDTGAVISVAFELTVSNRSQPEAVARLAQQKEQAQELYKQLIENSEAVKLVLSSDSVLQKVLGKIDSTNGDSVDGALRQALGVSENVFNAALDATVKRLTGEDPAITAFVTDPAPLTTLPANQASGAVSATNQFSAGSIQANVQTTNVSVSQQISATWSSTATSSLEATTLNAATATVVDSHGNTVGTGAVALAALDATSLSVSGNDQFNVNGNGSLTAYGPAETNLGVSGNWDSYSATVTGSVTITLTTDGLTLNGTTLPAGTYKITTASAALSGSGQTTSPNFSGSMSITATGGVVSLGPSSGSISSGGSPLDPTNGVTLDGYSGTINVSANGNGTDAVTLSGAATNALTVSGSPAIFTTDQNTPVTFAATVTTSLADTYALSAQAPQGWTVAISATGNVTVTPAPGAQVGTYAIQLTAQSSTDPNLTADAFVTVNITATPPGMTLAVNTDPEFTVPFNGAQVPTAYQAVIHNTGPTADTYNLTFPAIPAGFTVLSSSTSVTIPAGATGIVGVYLQPSGTLPAPGTSESFSVTATSASGAESPQTATVNFAMPTIAAVTLTDDPETLSTTPSLPVTTTLTITNVGNVPYDAAINPTLPSGWAISGGNTPVSLAIGTSTTEIVTITPAAGAPLNTTQDVTLTYGQAAAQSTVSVIGVTPNPSTVEADTQVDVSASVLAGLTSAEQGSVSYTVTDSHATVVFTSTPVAITLPEVIGVTNVDLGTLDTTGFSPGAYTINVTVDDSSNHPIAGATGQGQLFIAAPITANQSLSSNTLEPGSGTVTNTLAIAAQGKLGQVATDSTGASVVTNGDLAYVIGAGDITIVNISNPASPTVAGTFGSGTLNSGGTNLGALAGNELVVASGNSNGTFKLLVYSLTNPSSPTLLGNTTIDYQFPGSLFVLGTTAFVTTSGIDYSGAGPSAVTDQYGDFLAIDFSNPASATLVGSVANSLGTPDGGANNINGATAVSSSLAYVVGSTSTGAATQTGSGQLQVVNISNPASLTVSDTLSIPGTIQALAVAVQGNRALVVGSTGGWATPFNTPSDSLTGNLTLTLLDITNPADPVILSSTPISSAAVSNAATPINIVALGGNQFAVSNVNSNGSPAVLVVDGSNPTSLGVTTFTGAGAVSGMATNGGILYASTVSGLDVYRAGSIGNVPVTVTVQVPTTTGVSIVAGSFNVAPNTITPGATSETLTWNFPSLASIPSGGITWQTNVTNLQAGQSLPVTLGTTVQYTALGTASAESLPPLVVAGVPDAQTLTLPIQVVVPGAAAIASAATAANQIGNTNLANQLNALSIALTNLVLNPTSLIYLGQVQAAIASLITQLTPDPFLAPFAPPLAAASTALGTATTAGQVQADVVTLGTALSSLAQAIADEEAHGFTIGLANNFAEVQPNSPSVFTITMHNTGTQTTTYDFSIPGLPAGVTATFSQPSVTLAPGATIPSGSPITVSLSESGNTLTPLNFTVVATAEGSPEITTGTPGQLELRPELVLVGAVTQTPPYTASGGTVDISTTLLSAVNVSRTFSVSYTVTDINGNLLFTSTPVTTTIGISATSTLVDLGNLNTTGFADGTDTITVTVVDQSAQPLPSAVGQGSLIVGVPVTAILSVNPATAPTGNPVVTNSLEITSSIPMADPLTLDGAVATTPATTVALYSDSTHNLAYVAGPNGIDIVDVSNPAAPVDDGTFGSSDIVKGGLTVGRVDEIGGTEYLVVGSTTVGNQSSAPPFTLLIYSLANPLSPSRVSTTTFNDGFLSDMVVEGDTVLVPVLSYDIFGGFAFEGQNGNVMAIDVSNPAAPTLDSALFGSADPNANTTQFGATIVNSQIAYIASSTATGGSTQSGTGRVLIVNYSDPSNLQNLGEVDIPGTYQVVDVAVEGNEALVVGRTGGNNGPGVTGTMTLSLLDITNPQSPTLLGTTLDTAAQFPTGGFKISAQPLGNGLFAVSEASVDGNSELMVVDPSNPNDIVVSYTPVTALVNEMAVSGNLLYTTSAQGLAIYNIGTVESIPLSVSVEVPTTTGVTIVPNSYSTPPSKIITGATFDTLVWNETLAFGTPTDPITWHSTVSNLTAGEVRPVTLGASLNFTSQGTAGTTQIAGTAVTGTPIISILPASQTVQPGATATYDVQLTNPTDTAVTYFITGVGGVGASVNSGPFAVAPHASVDVPLQAFSNVGNSLGDSPFTVSVQSSNGTAKGTAQADRILAGSPIIVANANAYGIVGTFIPTQATIGQGDSIQFTLQMTNTGSTDEHFNPQISGLPSGVFGNFNQSNIDVPPGANNLRGIPLVINAQSGVTPGVYPFTVTITATDGSSKTTVQGTVTLAPEGVTVSLTPSTGPAGSTYNLSVTNKGTVTDTFNLSLAGPAAVVSSLGANSVTLTPGQSKSISVSVGAINFADTGSLQLTAIATSQSNSAVEAQSTASITIPTSAGLSTGFTPPSVTLPAPGPTSFAMLVNNLGNINDSYTATITGTTGDIAASLIGLDGLPTQSIPLFDLPGLSTGELQLATNLESGSQGTVTVTITDANGLVSSSTATVTIPAIGNPNTTTTVSSDHPSGSTYGQSVEFTATISGGISGTPTGSVQFEIDGADVGTPVTVGGGTAEFTTSMLTATGHTITAVYTSDNLTDFANSQNDLTQNVSPAPLTVTAASPSKLYGAALPTLTYSAGTFVNGDTAATALTGALSTTATASSPVAGYPISQGTLAAANYTITFVAGTLHVTPAPLTVTANSPSKVYGAALPALTFTADTFVNGDTAATALTGALSTTATAASPVANYPISQGTLAAANYTITFVSGTLSVTTAPLVITADNKTKTAGAVNPPLTFTPSGFVNGDTVSSLTTQPTLSTTATTTSPASTYPITASGAVDPNYSISYVPGTLTVTAVATGTATKTTLSVSCGNVATVYGQSITFTATVTSSAKTGTPSGIVTFLDGGTVLGTGTLKAGHGGDVATFSTGSLAPGAHTITAVYAGGGGFAGSSSSPLTQNVNKAATSTSLACSTASTGVGQPVNLTATITIKSPGGGTPTGSVTFKDGSTVLSSTPVTLVSGKYQATFSISTLAIGKHSITAVYSGDANFSTSTSSALSENITKNATTTSLTSSLNPAVLGQSVTFTATVSTSAIGTPTGSVTFKDGNTTLGTQSIALVAGQYQATFTTSSLSVASHSITAIYGGDANFSTSTSHSLSESISKDATTTTVSSSANPGTSGQSLTLTAKIAVVAPGSGTPTGTVTFRDGSSSLGTGTLQVVGGIAQATFTTSKLSLGTHSITAVYGGNSNYGGSTSAILSEVINAKGAVSPAVANPLDVNGDGAVTPLDALMIINALDSGGPRGTQSYPRQLDGLRCSMGTVK